MSLLEVSGLTTCFVTNNGRFKAVDDINFQIEAGETFGLVGESGCGKTISALSLMRLLPPPGRIIAGNILFMNEKISAYTKKQFRQIRGSKIAMIFQEPMTSLNPVFTIGNQIIEAILLHQKNISKKDAQHRTLEMLSQVGIPSPEHRLKEYPHQLSGGMRQRVMIAMALSCNPKLLIADEPTTALDVTIQAQILDILEQLKKKMGMGVILITHDLGIIAKTAKTVAIMYAGKIVEYTTVNELFNNPLHPYTQGLLNSIPKINSNQKRLVTIPGMVPGLVDLPDGCYFAPRCNHAKDICKKEYPEFREYKKKHQVACWMVGEWVNG
ncbi:MAG: ABC transporter ATP-binding protein [bacterium]